MDNETISHKEIFSIYESFAQNIDFPGGSDGKVSVYNVGDLCSIPGLGRSPGEGNDNPVSTLAWKIPQMEGPGKLQSMGSQRVRHDRATSLHFAQKETVKSTTNRENSLA